MDRPALRRAAVLVIASAMGLSTAAGPSAPTVRAEVTPRTLVALDSEAGEGIGLGRAWTFVPPSDTLTGAGGASAARVHVENAAVSFDIELSAPTGQELVVGAYEDAKGGGGTVPGIAVARGSQGCGGANGRFDVLEAPVVDASDVLVAFAADFEFRCDTTGPTLYGSVRVASSIDVQAIRASVTDIAFGTAPLFDPGDPSPVVYANVGTLPVTMGSPTLGGANPGAFGVATDCPAVLAVDATCTVDVRFAPDNQSYLAALLVQPTDALRWGHATPLSGTGQAGPVDNDSPAKAVAFTSLPFGHGGTTYGLAGSGSWIACPGDYEALWYKLTSPVKRVVRLEDPFGGATVSVQPSPTGMFTACGIGQPVVITAEAGVTYWIKVQRRYPGPQLLGLKATAGPADTEVAATGIGINRTTFYPVADGYVDTVTLRGTRNEKASVAASIYAPTGGKVRSLAAGAAIGAYAIAWNGKSTSGALVAAGRYRVVQTVTDLWGNRLTTTSYVNVSRKKLYTYTYARTLNGAAYSALGDAGTGWVSKGKSSYADGVRIATGSQGSAGVGYAFTVPAATIYKSIRFEVLGRGNLVAGAGTEVGVQDWTLCTGWDDSCVDTWSGGPAAYGWEGIKVPGTRHVSSRHVRGYVEVWTYGGISKWEDIRDVRAIVVYGILK